MPEQRSQRLETDDQLAEKLGLQLAKELGLKKVNGRYPLRSGSKTATGLARTAWRILAGEWPDER